MSGKFAATVGGLTEHEAVLGGVGSPDVLINAQPAWRAEVDIHACKAHGPESVLAGSENVLVNGHRATRLGDFLQGGGLFNRIAQGSTNVLIGAPQVGMAAPDRAKKFCVAYCALKKDWKSLSPAERRARMTALVGEQFKAFGAPGPGVTDCIKAGTGAGASWSPNKWELNFPEGTFDSDDPPGGGAVFHECRHGEQEFMAMRERAGRSGGSSAPASSDPARGSGPVSASDLADMSGAPLEAAKAASEQPIDPGTPEARWAHLAADESLNKTGRERCNQVTRAYYQAVQDDKKGDTYHDVSPAGHASTGEGGRPRAAEAYEDYERLPNGQDAMDNSGIGECGGC